MEFILILLSFLCLIPNFDSSSELSNIGAVQIIVDWAVTLVATYLIIHYSLAKFSSLLKHQVFSVWLIGLIICELILAFSWTPFLPSSTPHWGFDPQRYYYYMSYYIQNGHFGMFGLNYRGILFFYLPFLLIFGLNPIVPMFVNSILLAISYVFIIRLLDKDIGFGYMMLFMLFPELLWFCVMSSREIPCAFALILSLYGYLSYMKEKTQKSLWIMLFGFVFMGAIRLPFMFALLIAICIYTSFYTKNKLVVIVAAILVLFVGMYLSSAMGSDVNQADLASSLSNKLSGNNKAMSEGYSQNSIAMLLIPHNPLEFIVYGIVRSVLYLFPSMDLFSFSLPSSFSIGNIYMIGFSSLIMYFTLPFVYNYIKRVLFLREVNSILGQFVSLTFLVYLLFIGCSNTTMIHIRYRIVYDLLYCVLLILFFEETPKVKILPIFYKWCIMSVSFLLIYFSYKNLF